ncbi:MAG: UDP-N-acetylmuramoyl-L-alanyl-D-glutamate--2,6-diaminopimelate ligase [Bilophila sp.]
MDMYSLSLLESRVREQKLDLCVDSRKVTPGCVFIALPGIAASPATANTDAPLTRDGSAFIADAVAQGAGFVVCRPEEASACGQANVVDCASPRQALGLLASARYGTGDLPFPVVGVTGTNGKTTVKYLLDHLFASTGRKTGVLGTVSYRWPGHTQEAPLTTPDCLELHAMLEQMREAEVGIAFMEASSHALDQDRTAGIPFAGVVFTNLTQDHLDYHGDMESYFRAKSRLFLESDGTPFQDRVMAIGTDDVWGRRLLGQLAAAPKAIGFGLKPRPATMEAGRYLEGRVLSSTTAGLHLHLRFGDQEWELKSPLVGDFNAENLLAVQALALGFGLLPAAFRCFETFYGVPGRLERIQNPQQLDIFVDYAHTPDALEKALLALRGAGFTRILTVFGCGGNRDRTKRPLMGEAVARLSDVVLLTSDNPRHEDPEAIMADVLPGLTGAREVITEVDRRLAISKALAHTHKGDALLVAGKGHERTQQIGAVKHPFSDQQTIREMLGCA